MILSFAKQQEIKKVSVNNQAEYEQIIQETESLEVDKLLGSAFYQDVDANPGSYTDLLEGSSFTDCNGNTVTHRGLYYVIAYMTYAEYVPQSNINDTFTGFVQKTRPNAENLSTGALKNLATQQREIGFNAWRLVEAYLNENCDIYPLWYKNQSKRQKNIVITGVKRTIR